MMRNVIKFALLFMLAHLDGLTADQQKSVEVKAQNKENEDVVTALVKVFHKVAVSSLQQLPPSRLLQFNKNLVMCIDLDSTLLTYRYKFRHYPKEVVEEFIADFLPQERSCIHNELMSFSHWLSDHPDTFECELLAADSLAWLQQVEPIARCCFALTARKRSIKDQTKNNLLRLGVDFGKWSHLAPGTRAAMNTKFPEVEISDGVIFTGNSVKKAAIMDALAEMVAKEFALEEPFTIVHIDDNLDEINAHYENKIGTCSTIPWSVLPIHFTGADEYLQSLANNELAYRKLWQDQILQLYDAFVLLTLH